MEDQSDFSGLDVWTHTWIYDMEEKEALSPARLLILGHMSLGLLVNGPLPCYMWRAGLNVTCGDTAKQKR